MQEQDKARFKSVMVYLCINFPDRTVNTELVCSYYEDLSGFDIGDIAIAARMYVRKNTRFPFVADLVELLTAGNNAQVVES